jgi:hypothetical protein
MIDRDDTIEYALDVIAEAVGEVNPDMDRSRAIRDFSLAVIAFSLHQIMVEMQCREPTI